MSRRLQFQQDSELVHGLKDGCEASFCEIYERYCEPLFLSVYRVIRDREATKDIVQELFLDIWKRRDSLAIRHLKGYLFTAAKYKVARHIDKTGLKLFQLEKVEELSLEADTAESYFQNEEILAIVDRYVNKLPAKCKEIFIMSRFENLTNKEIAEKLNVSKDTVENQIKLALRILQPLSHLRLS